MEKLYYSVAEVRSIIYDNSISSTTIQNLVKDNQIPSVRLGRRIFIPKWWIAKQVEKATVAPAAAQ